MKNAASLATLAALALLGVVLAYWSWAWLAPPPAPRAPAAVETAGPASSASSSASGLFGRVTAGPVAAAASGALRLLGVVAASAGRLGHAVLRLDAKTTVAVLQGEDIEPGLRLVEVHVDHIVLERNGARETLAWPEKNSK